MNNNDISSTLHDRDELENCVTTVVGCWKLVELGPMTIRIVDANIKSDIKFWKAMEHFDISILDLPERNEYANI